MLYGLIILISITYLEAAHGYHSSKTIESQIIGGTEVYPNSIPYQLSFQVMGTHICGATLIAADFAITSAKCCMDEYAEEVTIVAGEHDLSVDSDTEQKSGVSKLSWLYYYENEYHKDICLVHLSSPFELNEFVNVAKLPSPNVNFTGQGVISGWGPNVLGGKTSKVLVSTQVTINEISICRQNFPKFHPDDDPLPDWLFCGINKVAHSCGGDMGGPMICNNDEGEKFFCGFTVSNTNCGEGFPELYTKVSFFVDWINLMIDYIKNH